MNGACSVKHCFIRDKKGNKTQFLSSRSLKPEGTNASIHSSAVFIQYLIIYQVLECSSCESKSVRQNGVLEG